MDKAKWNDIERFIEETLVAVQPQLDKETIDFVHHYLKHGEYEMAFEGLFLEIMKLKAKPDIDFEKSDTVARLMKLDDETIFDADFWSKFQDFLKRMK